MVEGFQQPAKAIGRDDVDVFASSPRKLWNRRARKLAGVSLGRPRARPLARNTASVIRALRPPRGRRPANLLETVGARDG